MDSKYECIRCQSILDQYETRIHELEECMRRSEAVSELYVQELENEINSLISSLRFSGVF